MGWRDVRATLHLYVHLDNKVIMFIIFLFPFSLVAGIKPGKLVEAHGSFSTASCTLCHAKHNSDDIKVWFVLYLSLSVCFIMLLLIIIINHFCFLFDFSSPQAAIMSSTIPKCKHKFCSVSVIAILCTMYMYLYF